jgi:hypothetical protein
MNSNSALHCATKRRSSLSFYLFSLISCQFVIALSACGGGGGSSTPPSSEVKASVPLRYQVAAAAPLSQCPTGGATIDAGFDTNANGVLDASEITSTQYVCNGATGATAATGATGATGATVASGAAGAAGAAGISTLVRVITEASGANCPAGGYKITAGADVNVNSTLDVGEVASTNYVCNGATGATGATGPTGAQGIQGVAGVAGSNGRNSLVAIVSDSVTCPYGGSKITSGLDTNNNSVLNDAEVTATSYACNGAPGASLNWQTITSNTQAQSNTGYLANGLTQVTVTLPASPNVGDVVRVSGLGAGGWKIGQNIGQRIDAYALERIGTPAVPWVSRDSTREWSSVASSADGSKLVAAVAINNGQIYTSSDRGVTWTAQVLSGDWRSVASSSDGSKLVAVVAAGRIYTSTDSGVNWTARDSNRFWRSVASSADGNNLVAVVSGGQIFTSADSGVSWLARDSSRFWRGVASSSNGNKLVAAVNGGQIYTSDDTGQTWTARESNRAWYAVASSSDGSKLVAVVSGGQIYTSNDSGLNWTARESSRDWRGVASSSDGSRLVAVAFGGQIYTSTDSGVSWIVRESIRNWQGVASSADGNTLLASEIGGQLYTTITATTTGVNGELSGSSTDAVELQYVGNGVFRILSSYGVGFGIK